MNDTAREDFKRDWCKTGGGAACGIFSLLFLDRGWGVKWILKLVAAGDEGPGVNIMEISKPATGCGFSALPIEGT